MSDDIDRAQQETEFMLAAALRRTRPKLIPTGKCLECETELIGIEGDYPALFCDRNCRDDFEKREKMRRINGGS
jgi:hypothetical protein